MNKVPNNQEVIDIAHGRDDAQLVGKARPRFVSLLCIGIAFAKPFVRQARKHLQRGFAGRHGIMRKPRDTKLELDIASVGNFLRSVNGIGTGRKQRAHFFFALDVKLTRFHTHAFVIIERLAGLDAHQHFLRIGILFLQIMAVVRGDKRNSHFTCKGD